MTYPEAVQYLDSFINYEKTRVYSYRQSLNLQRFKAFLQKLHNPQHDLRSIHIAGTKGKGSTSAFIAYILRQGDFRVGLYTSPHLSDFRERIRILAPGGGAQGSIVEFEGMISEEEIISLLCRLRPVIEEFNLSSKYGRLSFFEVYTALAFLYFKEKQVDYCVLETGLGGRLDATNTVNPLVAAITPISYEHRALLGNTLKEIASEKAGIIKNKRFKIKDERLVVISAPQEKEAIKVIRDRAREKNAALYEIGKDIFFRRKEASISRQSFDIGGEFGRLADLEITQLGLHQVVNATLAVAVVLALRKFYQLSLSIEAIKKGLYNTLWPGRFEIACKQPLVILDGAQNAASAGALRTTIIEHFPDKRIILVLGISQDKDIKEICNQLIPISAEIILTQADNPRAADVDDIEQTIGNQKPEYRKQIIKTKDAGEAIELAREKAGFQDLILVAGSLFLVGEVRDFLVKTGKYAKRD
ncbi:MAG: bifunctional folylpolyglutamate synthase/dihydrofolate synthase [Candidatus Omnitrophica bacterium]|nr:bifunctional folylpolyglutamate synthase/dihydrofolate synthase [Candidatus Omnitrophota bacterium]